MKPDYGIQSPIALKKLGLVAFVCFAFALALGGGHSAYTLLLLVGFGCLLVVAIRIWGSTVGKPSMRAGIVDSLRIQGHERILDLGCGRGYLMMGIAHRLKSGRVVGIDLWLSDQLTGNDRASVLYNARAERVEEKIELHEGDLRALPFEEDEFDAVVSSWAISQIGTIGQQRVALKETARVLKPGGMILIVDFGSIRRHVEALRAEGMVDISISDPNFIFFMPSIRLTARKPI